LKLLAFLNFGFSKSPLVDHAENYFYVKPETSHMRWYKIAGIGLEKVRESS